MESKIEFSSLYSSANIHRIENNECCIVFVHGFSESAICWDDIVNKLKGHGNLVTYDCAGHGDNAKLWPNVSFELYVEQLGQLVRHLKKNEKFEKIILVGHSQGAAIAAQYAIQKPEYVNGLMLISAFFRVDMPLKAIWNNFLQLVQQGDSRRFWDLNSSLLLGVKSGIWSGLRGQVIQQHLDFFVKEQLVVLINALLNVSVRVDPLKLKNKPVYLIHGEYDIMVPNYYSKEILKDIPDAKYIEIDNANHLLVELEPNVSQLLLEMIENLQQCNK